MDLRMTEGFLGTGASLLADLTLLAYIFLLVPAMLVGFVFARRKMFEPYHKYTMTGIVIFNWVLILFLMVVSYRDGVAPGIPENLGNVTVWLPTVHLVTGAVSQILATYLVLRMWLEPVLPQFLMVKNIKAYMRFTLAGWLITAVLGGAIYLTWYVAPAAAGSGGDDTVPVATEEAGAPSATENATDDVDDMSVTEEAATPQATEDSDADEDEPTATEDSGGGEPAATEGADNDESEPAATEDADAPAATEDAG